MGYEPRPGLPGYWSYDGLEIQADIATHRFVIEHRQPPCGPRRRTLDIGAGAGALSKQLIDAGFDVSCTTWDDRVKLPIPKYPLDLDVPFGLDAVGGQPFDLVCCIEVIEHVENPAALLRSCRAAVTPTGRVVLSTPERGIGAGAAAVAGARRAADVPDPGGRAQPPHLHAVASGPRVPDRAGRLRGRGEAHHRAAEFPRPGAEAGQAAAVLADADGSCSGDLDGETRIYVLAPRAAAARAHGPGEVY